jgi:anti-sigma-K factor RskA
MSDHKHISELIPAYALGCLDNDEAERVAGHLADCSDCQADLASYRQVVDELAYTAPTATPPPGLRDRLLETIQPVSAKSSSQSWWQTLAGLFRRPVPAWSLAGALVLLLVLGVWLILSSEPVIKPDASMQTITLLGTEASPESQAVLVISSDGDEGGLVVEDLATLDVDQQYQLWLVDREGQSTSGAIFSVDANGYGTTVITSPLPLTSYAGFCITVEPAGGSAYPTGEMVLGYDY